jgi:hypothetical protein
VHLGTSKGANRNLHHWMKNNPVSAVNSHSIPQEPVKDSAQKQTNLWAEPFGGSTDQTCRLKL